MGEQVAARLKKRKKKEYDTVCDGSVQKDIVTLRVFMADCKPYRAKARFYKCFWKSVTYFENCTWHK